MPEIITFGETMAALAPGSSGFLRYIKNYEMKIAGAESNLAIGVAKLGHTAGWISKLGQDEFGELVRNAIRGEGVDTSCVRFDREHPTGVMFKQVLNARETSVFYYREDSAASHMDGDLLKTVDLTGCRIVHLTGITPVLSDSCKEMVEKAMDLAEEKRFDLSFDPNIRRKLWGEKDHTSMLRQMALCAQFLLLGADEAVSLFRTSEPEGLREIVFASGKTKWIALKDGAKGATVITKEEVVPIPPFPCSCIDPIGAGDAFNAAFLCGILEGKSAWHCGQMGAVAGALATETFGDTEGYPSRERLEMALLGQQEIAR